jgi:DNA-binding cell septation regulator SpoVG
MPEIAKPAGVSGGHRELLVTSWKAVEKNTLRGFVSFTLPSGLVIHNVSLHEKNGVRWIGLPGRRYTKDDGTASYSPVVEFANNDAREHFRAAALRAVDLFMAANHE